MEKKIHLTIAWITYPITLLHLLFGHYSHEKLIEGIIFYTVAFILYVSLVLLYWKNETGRKMVVYCLLLFAMICIVIMWTAY
ncbi:hypothetical protein FZW96_00820 [Bacillus sp. BGMRC 2118]|nr:hypothetical protein FZW96_00820 [Bacillus sp. BGMRC 2118]